MLTGNQLLRLILTFFSYNLVFVILFIISIAKFHNGPKIAAIKVVLKDCWCIKKYRTFFSYILDSK